MSDLRSLTLPVEGTGRARVPIRQRNWKARVVLPGGLALGFVALLGYSARDVVLPGREVRVVPVVAKASERSAGTGTVVVQAPGWIEADPFSVSVSALADGVVKEVLVLEGESVAAGQPVARLVDDDARLALRRAEAETALKRAELNAAEAARAAAQSDWDNPVERTRQLDTAEAMLAESRAELDRLPAELAAEEALLIELHAEHERVVEVFESRSAATIELIRAKQQCDAQTAKLRLAEGRKAILEATIRRLEAEAVAAREQLRLRIPEKRALADAMAGVAKAEADLRRAESALSEATLRLERMEIRSPVAGVVQARLIEPGSKLSLAMDDPRSAQAVRLYDPARLQVRVDVPLADAAKVGLGQEAEVRVDVLADRTFAGRVSRVVHEADVQKNTVQFKVAIADPAPELKPEMLARVKFFGRSTDSAPGASQVVFAPERLVQRAPGRPARVWLADPSRGVAFSREVALGDLRVGEWVEIRQGLQPGDRLIDAEPASLVEGQRIRVAGETSENGGTQQAEQSPWP